MIIIDESRAKGISKRVIREVFAELGAGLQNDKVSDLMGLPPKPRAREIIKLCKRHKRFVRFEERYRDTKNWELMFGEWSLGYSGRVPPESRDQYDRLYLDLNYSARNALQAKFFYIALSNHALLRLIMRSGKDLTSKNEIYMFIRSIAKDAVFAGMSMLEGNPGSILYSKGFYLPLVLQKGENLYGKGAVVTVVKTVMPDHFIVSDSQVIDRANFKRSMFDCHECF